MKTDIDTQIEERIKTFMDDNLHVVLEDEGDQSVIPTEQFAHDLAKAIKTLLDTAVEEARIELATDLLRKVKLEYEAGGRYPGHIILPWEEIVRPELVKLKSTSKEDK